MVNDYKQLLQLVKRGHAHQTRNGGHVPYWVHCYRVSKLLEGSLDKTKEGSPKERQVIILAALGHDLYEDTKVTREYIIKKFGAKIDSLIFEMTNVYGDHEIRKYCEKLKTISEAGLLIKLADMSDNMIGGAYAVHENGHKWTKKFLYPIVHQQWLTVSKINFSQFPKTALYLKSLVDFGHNSLQMAIENYPSR